MTATAKVVSNASGTLVGADTLRTFFKFCAIGLTMLLVAASFGLDLSPGFF
jgi:hypothetical protein